MLLDVVGADHTAQPLAAVCAAFIKLGENRIREGQEINLVLFFVPHQPGKVDRALYICPERCFRFFLLLRLPEIDQSLEKHLERFAEAFVEIAVP